ncbi:MAG: rod shape-determining protein, partial [Clostridiales bacterium]|nr:rod shape-determining protein [Clostridiales bacterium]
SDMTQSMIHDFLRKVCGNFLFKPRVIICVPSFITDVESRAVFEAARSAGARKVYLIQEPIAALLGTGKDISEPRGNMIVDIGGGTTDVAVISMNGIVAAKSIRIAGNKFDEALIKYINNKHKISIGEKTAEQAKMQIANVYDAIGKKKMVVRGRHLIEGLPSQVEITDIEVARALKPVVSEIVAAIRTVMEQTPPELVGDIHDTGITLTGGGALLNGLDRYIEREINAPCNIAENPIECVVRGTSIAFNKIGELRDGFEMISQYKYK